MRKTLLAIIAVAGACLAADATGTWSGTISMTNGNDSRDDTALLVLMQNGSEITGTIGPSEERRIDITKGSATGNEVYIEAVMEGENKLVLRLKMDGDKLAGDMKAEGPQAPPISGKLALQRKK